jgi:hypothetical protein
MLAAEAIIADEGGGSERLERMAAFFESVTGPLAQISS